MQGNPMMHIPMTYLIAASLMIGILECRWIIGVYLALTVWRIVQ